MTTTTLPASTGVVSTNTYDNADRLTAISHVKGGTTIASVNYTLDAVGNRTQRVDQQGTHTYAYDNVYRLTSVTYPGPSTTTYGFDAFGNRTSMVNGSGTTTYAYDDADRITSVTKPGPTTTNYTWDDNGNLTARGSDTFAWDIEDRMTSATVAGTTTTFAYRGDGLRESRTTGGVTNTSTWDINRGLPVELEDATGRYVYGAGLVSQIAAGGTYYYLADGLGSTMAMVDTAGVVQKSYTYDVYGKPTASGSASNEFDFAGQKTDNTGLQYLRARYMDPETGTFLSREPLAVIPGWRHNPFGYAGGRPVMETDPTGLCPSGISKKTCKIVDGIIEGVDDVKDKVKDEVVGVKDGAIGSIPHEAPEAVACVVVITLVGASACYDARKISDHAIALTEVFYPSEKWSGTNDMKDAFRHCYWSATLRANIPLDNLVTYAHEVFDNEQSGDAAAMDHYNNKVGASIGAQFADHGFGLKLSDPRIISACLDAAATGALRALD